jgi:putative flippase GtrA
MGVQFIRFCGAGLCGFALDVSLFTLMVRGGFSSSAALSVSYPCGMLINFFFCWRFVFGAHAASFISTFFRYLAIAVLVFCANQLLIPLISGYFPSNPSLARMGAAAVVSFAQYGALKIIAFG